MTSEDRSASGRPGRRLLVLGGARSGKSAYAESRVAETGLFRHYIATGRAWDEEMAERIRHHRAARGEGWVTHEDPLELSERLRSLDAPDNAILVDCLTLWLTNLMMETRNLQSEFSLLGAAIAESRATVVLVSNEVGLGIVPDNAMAREFRDQAGRLHQLVAATVDEVYFVAAGLPLKMKG
jgi:adenosylcobinamide kinase/adenosylcobinamide-phosphate guanylyltransferase